MNKTNILIVDDEPLARDILIDYVNRIDKFTLVDTCTNAVEAFNIIGSTNIDLIFLDIQMPGISGISLIKNIKNPPKVIFTTAYPDYAIEGFELEAVDYLLKPISFERFLKGINRYFNLFGSSAENNTGEELREKDYKESFMYVRAENKMVKLLLNEIVYIESSKNNCKIFTAEKEVLANISISAIEEKIPNHKFMRIHRSFIVAVDKIEAFTKATVETKLMELPIGRNYRDEVWERLTTEY